SMPLGEMKGIVDIGYQSMQELFGTNIGILFSVLIMLLTLSSLNSTILSGARIYYAMAEERRFFKIVGKLHPRFKVPAISLWLQCLWSIILIFSGTFNQLLTYTVFVMVLSSFLSGGALFILRKRNGDSSSEIRRGEKVTYRIKAYPILLSIYMIVSAWIMITVLINRPTESIIGLIIVGLGIPFYLYWKRRG
ncbi:MAG: amino acid permease, partial [Aliifodinibius sp.]|nr:amino acid permease [Fodinibius sp.]NIV14162.1 amino acid permease [Fodinibius sp.]NIY27989.1 amino acid permease [Fodinibius sp.]